MRKNKYRAWDLDQNVMIIDYQEFIPVIVTSRGVFKLDPTSEKERWIELDRTRFKLMEYLGFKVKNEKELYEGDIIKFPDYYEKDWGTGYIKYECSSWWIWDIKGKIIDKKNISIESYVVGNFPTIPPGNPNDFEIIGNKYKNQNLLNF